MWTGLLGMRLAFPVALSVARAGSELDCFEFYCLITLLAQPFLRARQPRVHAQPHCLGSAAPWYATVPH